MNAAMALLRQEQKQGHFLLSHIMYSFQTTQDSKKGEREQETEGLELEVRGEREKERAVDCLRMLSWSWFVYVSMCVTRQRRTLIQC